MKKQLENVLLVAAVTGVFSLTSCKETAENEPAPPVQNEMHAGDMESEDAAANNEGIQNDPEFENEATAEVFEQYLAIKTALVQTDAVAARERAKKLITAMEKEEYQGEVLTGAREIANSTNVEEQRKAFSTLTQEMESVLDGALASGEIYKQYCPMAFEGKGDYWYSDSKEIRNPYFGDKMLKCGRVEATIN